MKNGILKSILLFFLKKYQLIRGNYRIYRDFRLLKKVDQNIERYPQKKYKEEDRILILVPHADDELISSHSFIENYKSQITLFYCSLTGSNNDVNNRITREREFKEYCHRVGVDYFISEPKTDLLEQLKTIISDYKPNVVCLPSCIDWHSEHCLLSDLLLDVLKDNDSIKFIDIYSVSFPMPPHFINFVSGMTREEHLQKWNLFGEIYKSQKSLNTYRFKCWERLYANYLGECYAVEYHHIFSTAEWKSWVLKKTGTIVSQSVISDIKAVLKLSIRLYAE